MRANPHRRNWHRCNRIGESISPPDRLRKEEEPINKSKFTYNYFTSKKKAALHKNGMLPFSKQRGAKTLSRPRSKQTARVPPPQEFKPLCCRLPACFFTVIVRDIPIFKATVSVTASTTLAGTSKPYLYYALPEYYRDIDNAGGYLLIWKFQMLFLLCSCDIFAINSFCSNSQHCDCYQIVPGFLCKQVIAGAFHAILRHRRAWGNR